MDRRDKSDEFSLDRWKARGRNQNKIDDARPYIYPTCRPGRQKIIITKKGGGRRSLPQLGYAARTEAQLVRVCVHEEAICTNSFPASSPNSPPLPPFLPPDRLKYLFVPRWGLKLEIPTLCCPSGRTPGTFAQKTTHTTQNMFRFCEYTYHSTTIIIDGMPYISAIHSLPPSRPLKRRVCSSRLPEQMLLISSFLLLLRRRRVSLMGARGESSICSLHTF